MRIEPVNIFFPPEDRAEIIAQIEDCLKRGQLSYGPHVDAFEEEFAAYTGSRHAVAMSCGTATIESVMRLLNVQGKEVLVQANAFFSTALGPILAGATVRLVDIDPMTFSPSIADLEAAVTENTVGVLLVHMGGIITPALPQIRQWCDARGLWLFEDCAHAHGSRLNGQHAGTFGLAAGFSLFATKVITSGEGGMLITDDDEIAREARLYRNLGKPEPWTSYHVRLGSNWRMSELHAIVGRIQLRRLDEFIAQRAEIAEQYTQLLGNIDWVMPVLPSHRSSWYKYPVLLDPRINRRALKTAMLANGVRLSGEIYERPLHKQPALRDRFAGQSFPKAEDVCARHICLPIYFGMKRKEVEYVVQTLEHAILEAIPPHRTVIPVTNRLTERGKLRSEQT